MIYRKKIHGKHQDNGEKRDVIFFVFEAGDCRWKTNTLVKWVEKSGEFPQIFQQMRQFLAAFVACFRHCPRESRFAKLVNHFKGQKNQNAADWI